MKTLIRIALAAFAAAATAAAAQEIKIGGLLETSGFVASLGQPGLEGAQLAVEQINAAGGDQRPQGRAGQRQLGERQHQDGLRRKASDRAGQGRRDRRADELGLRLRRGRHDGARRRCR